MGSYIHPKHIKTCRFVPGQSPAGRIVSNLPAGLWCRLMLGDGTGWNWRDTGACLNGSKVANLGMLGFFLRPERR